MSDEKKHEQLSLFPENSAFGDERNVVGRITQLNDTPEKPWIPSPEEIQATERWLSSTEGETHLKKEARRKEAMALLGERLADALYAVQMERSDDAYDAVQEAADLHRELTQE